MSGEDHQQQASGSSSGSNNLAQVAQGQMMQAAMNAASAGGGGGGASAAHASSSGAQNQQQQHQQHQPPVMDLASILAKIQSLEKEKSDMRSQLEVATSRLSKLQESKRAEMEQMMNSTITKWLENLNPSDAGAKDQLKDGLNRLVQSGDESGVWNVIACASSNWVSNVNQIEQLTQQVNEYREKERLLSCGIFQSEESRTHQHNSALPPVGDKRKIDGISQAHGATSGMGGDIWSEFQSMMMAGGGNMGMDYGIMVDGSGRGGGVSGGSGNGGGGMQ
jgi:hypothetical protein